MSFFYRLLSSFNSKLDLFSRSSLNTIEFKPSGYRLAYSEYFVSYPKKSKVILKDFKYYMHVFPVSNNCFACIKRSLERNHVETLGLEDSKKVFSVRAVSFERFARDRSWILPLFLFLFPFSYILSSFHRFHSRSGKRR